MSSWPGTSAILDVRPPVTLNMLLSSGSCKEGDVPARIHSACELGKSSWQPMIMLDCRKLSTAVHRQQPGAMLKSSSPVTQHLSSRHSASSHHGSNRDPEHRAAQGPACSRHRCVSASDSIPCHHQSLLQMTTVLLLSDG
jgi:hypothetical protein